MANRGLAAKYRSRATATKESSCPNSTSAPLSCRLICAIVARWRTTVVTAVRRQCPLLAANLLDQCCANCPRGALWVIGGPPTFASTRTQAPGWSEGGDSSARGGGRRRFIASGGLGQPAGSLGIRSDGASRRRCAVARDGPRDQARLGGGRYPNAAHPHDRGTRFGAGHPRGVP